MKSFWNFCFRHPGILLSLITICISTPGCSKDTQKWETHHPTIVNEPKQYGTPFNKVPSTADIIMYEVNIQAFSSAGNLAGVTGKLDSIQKLGVNVIWLMPVYTPGELNSVGSPYAVKDYLQVNPRFGNLDDLRQLISEAHSRGMAVILDWVANHTSWDHKWISSKSWYSTDASGNIIIPPGTNWNDVAELNYSNNEMRREMIRCMKYWILEANADGYRCDYAEGVPLDFWKAAIDTLNNIPGRDIIMFAEAGKKELLSAGFQLIFGWNFYGKLLDVFEGESVTGLITLNNTEQSSMPAGKQVLRWISNHDQNAWDDTPVNLFKGRDGSLAAFTLALYMGGVPLIYNGQEVACNTKLSFFNTSVNKIIWTENPDFKQQFTRLINFRKNSDAVKKGNIVSYTGTDVVAFKRILNEEEVLVIVNVRNTSRDFQLPGELQNTTWVDVMADINRNLGTVLNLGAYEFLVLKK